jgi:hypothetical protein
MAKRQEFCDLLRTFYEGHRIGHDRRLGVLAVRVMLTQGGIRGDPLAQKGAGGVDDTGGMGGDCRLGHSRLLLRAARGLA